MEIKAVRNNLIEITREVMPLAVIVALTAKILSLAFNVFSSMSATLLIIASVLMVMCAITPNNTSQPTSKKSLGWIFALITVALILLFFYKATISIPMAAMSFFLCLLILRTILSDQE